MILCVKTTCVRYDFSYGYLKCRQDDVSAQKLLTKMISSNFVNSSSDFCRNADYWIELSGKHFLHATLSRNV